MRMHNVHVAVVHYIPLHCLHWLAFVISRNKVKPSVVAHAVKDEGVATSLRLRFTTPLGRSSFRAIIVDASFQESCGLRASKLCHEM